MSDRLRMDYINSLPQPFLCRKYGDRDYWWPVELIEVETGLMRIDVCGLLDKTHISEIAMFQDAAGCEHDPDSFYSDYGVNP